MIARGPVPEYAVVAGAYNARVARLERLRANTSLVIHAKSSEGKRLNEQVEANLQFVLPRSVALRIDKVGQTVFYLGSNDERYWWMDLTDNKIAMVGIHEKATAEKAAAFGLPVHPLDLLELLGVIPMPGVGEGGAPVVEWSRDGRRLGITTDQRWGGSRRIFMDPETYDPMRIELLDGMGNVAVAAALSRYQSVDVDGDARARARIAGRLDIEAPGRETTVIMSVYDPENSGHMKQTPFDLEALLRAYGVKDVVDIDRDDGPRASGPGRGGK